MTPSLDAYWSDLVTTALLGSDRREPPSPPPGGLADLAADDPRATASSRLLQQVAATSTIRRAGVTPGPPVAPPASPAPDPRPFTPPSATSTWYRLVADWPVLEDEWVLAVATTGHRLAPELVVPLLARHRTDGPRHARALAAAGPLGQWMTDQWPRLACTSRLVAVPEAIGELPELVVTPDLVPLLGSASVARELAGGLASGRFTLATRAVLVNLVARVHPSSLVDLTDALDRADPSLPTVGVAFALADLARLRHHMLTELESA